MIATIMAAITTIPPTTPPMIGGRLSAQEFDKAVKTLNSFIVLPDLTSDVVVSVESVGPLVESLFTKRYIYI